MTGGVFTLCLDESSAVESGRLNNFVIGLTKHITEAKDENNDEACMQRCCPVHVPCLPVHFWREQGVSEVADVKLAPIFNQYTRTCSSTVYHSAPGILTVLLYYVMLPVSFQDIMNGLQTLP